MLSTSLNIEFSPHGKVYFVFCCSFTAFHRHASSSVNNKKNTRPLYTLFAVIQPRIFFIACTLLADRQRACSLPYQRRYIRSPASTLKNIRPTIAPAIIFMLSFLFFITLPRYLFFTSFVIFRNLMSDILVIDLDACRQEAVDSGKSLSHTVHRIMRLGNRKSENFR